MLLMKYIYNVQSLPVFSNFEQIYRGRPTQRYRHVMHTAVECTNGSCLFVLRKVTYLPLIVFTLQRVYINAYVWTAVTVMSYVRGCASFLGLVNEVSLVNSVNKSQHLLFHRMPNLVLSLQFPIRSHTTFALTCLFFGRPTLRRHPRL